VLGAIALMLVRKVSPARASLDEVSSSFDPVFLPGTRRAEKRDMMPAARRGTRRAKRRDMMPGRAEGYDAGRKAGHDAGRAEGYDAGRKDPGLNDHDRPLSKPALGMPISYRIAWPEHPRPIASLPLDFINKAFECLDLIGWQHAARCAAHGNRPNGRGAVRMNQRSGASPRPRRHGTIANRP
jgi:hypothetical protein